MLQQNNLTNESELPIMRQPVNQQDPNGAASPDNLTLGVLPDDSDSSILEDLLI